MSHPPVSGPFGILRGYTNGPDRGLSQPEVAWTATDPSAVTGPGIETARWLLQGCQRGYEL